MSEKQSRRRFMQLTGAAVSTTVALGAMGSAAADKYSWEEVPSPTGSTIYGAVQTQEGPYAVGSNGVGTFSRLDRAVDRTPRGGGDLLLGVLVQIGRAHV